MTVWRHACRRLTRRAAVEALLHNRVLNSNIYSIFHSIYSTAKKNFV